MHSQTSNHPMSMIEAGARAMFRLEDTEGEEWDSKHIMEDVRESYREAARACWAAMVEGLTDERLNRCDEAGHCAAIKDLDRDAMYFDAFRAELRELTEVGDE